MTNKLIFTDGAMKSGNLLMSDDPSVWNFMTNAPQSDIDTLYARVSAAFRAFNLKANTVGNMPFALYKLTVKDKTGRVKATGNEEIDDSADGDEFDSSATWENKVGFLHNPSELLRLDTLSYMVSNAIYNLQTTDKLAYKPRGLVNAIPYSFKPWLTADNTQLQFIERTAGTRIERYGPDGKQIAGVTKARLIYMWRLDHTTELLPSPNTEALAIMNAAGEVFFADLWIKHFYARGGVKPTLIAMKGMIDNTAKEEKEKSWDAWLRGLGKFFGRTARIYNAESIDAKPIGSGVDDIKDNKVYEQAIANIAMGTGMPLSLLMANSANYATAKEEKATWFESDIIPFCNWLAYEYNRQVFNPIGLRLEFHPETLDPQQEDETERAGAMLAYMNVIEKCPTYEVFIGMASTMGLELSDKLTEALEVYYQDKAKKAEEIQLQMQNAGVVVGPDGKPIPQKPDPNAKPGDKPKPAAFAQDDNEDPEEDKPAEKPAKKPVPPAKSEMKANETSAMIALRIPNVIRDDIKRKYPFVDAETLNELHITLVYLGDNRTIDKMDVMRAVSDFGMYQSPIKGTLQGLARFINGQEVDPLVVTFDSHQMPGVYNTLCNVLDNYHVPFHKDHGFIPHMTLAYIPSDADMPIDTIEPIEINFSEVYYVDGNVWLPVELTGYDNKAKPAKWQPSINELEELRIWRKAAVQKWKRGESLDFEYIPHKGGLPDRVTDTIKTQLIRPQEWTEETLKAVFDVEYNEPEVKADNSDLRYLADAMNNLARVKIPVST